MVGWECYFWCDTSWPEIIPMHPSWMKLPWRRPHVRQTRHCLLEPFGGIQLIFVGDFAQIVSVPGNLSMQASSNCRRGGSAVVATTGPPPYPPKHPGADYLLNIPEMTAFAFHTALWRDANFCHVHWTHVYHRSDTTFVQALMDLRQQRPQYRLGPRLCPQMFHLLGRWGTTKMSLGLEPLKIPRDFYRLYCIPIIVMPIEKIQVGKIPSLALDRRIVASGSSFHFISPRLSLSGALTLSICMLLWIQYTTIARTMGIPQDGMKTVLGTRFGRGRQECSTSHGALDQQGESTSK